jgi:hypothetical protein
MHNNFPGKELGIKQTKKIVTGNVLILSNHQRIRTSITNLACQFSILGLLKKLED